MFIVAPLTSCHSQLSNGAKMNKNGYHHQPLRAHLGTMSFLHFGTVPRMVLVRWKVRSYLSYPKKQEPWMVVEASDFHLDWKNDRFLWYFCANAKMWDDLPRLLCERRGGTFWEEPIMTSARYIRFRPNKNRWKVLTLSFPTVFVSSKTDPRRESYERLFTEASPCC